jgi:hypothetical protein
LYTANDLAKQNVIVLKYEISSNITPTSYLSLSCSIGISRLGYTEIQHGLCYVATKQQFTNFDFEKISFMIVNPKDTKHEYGLEIFSLNKTNITIMKKKRLIHELLIIKSQ